MTHRSTPWLAALLLAASGTLAAQTLRVGLAEDPDVLDPTLARTFVGRIVFAALCVKLVEVDGKLAIQPQLTQSWEWSADNKTLTMKIRPGVTFHDGEKLDAAAVKFNLERHKNLAGSNRRGELALMNSVDVVDPMTVRIHLSAPFSPLLATLADRAGMMVSPKAAQAAGDKIGAKPGCSGPFKTTRSSPPPASRLPPPPAPTARDANPWTLSEGRARRQPSRSPAPAPTVQPTFEPASARRHGGQRDAVRWVPFFVLLFIAGTAVRLALEAAGTGRLEALVGPLVMFAFVAFMAWRLARRPRSAGTEGLRSSEPLGGRQRPRPARVMR